jgi:hypothetical protein
MIKLAAIELGLPWDIWPVAYLRFKPPINDPGFKSRFARCTQVEQR